MTCPDTVHSRLAQPHLAGIFAQLAAKVFLKSLPQLKYYIRKQL